MRLSRRAAASEALIKRTKEWSETFTNGLPNFVCQQSTTRYMQESKSSGWQVQDVVTAKVVYEDGKEDYREITVGGKRTNKGMLDLGGSTSTGEFASTLHSLFSEEARHSLSFSFNYLRDSPTAIYDFKVALPNSNWLTKIGGQGLRPAYSGSVWIDRSTAEVRRIEMQADNIPKDFPLDSFSGRSTMKMSRWGLHRFCCQSTPRISPAGGDRQCAPRTRSISAITTSIRAKVRLRSKSNSRPVLTT